MSVHEPIGERMEETKHRLASLHCMIERALFAVTAGVITIVVGLIVLDPLGILDQHSLGEVALLNGGLAFYTHTVSERVSALLHAMAAPTVTRPLIGRHKRREAQRT